ncbi:undecaprenyl-diphosphate phosphatase [Candidatus Bathyarchaeota archaeon]|nr:undecaprenyl-diphosphate phosphatase [Candidatus Bathyarchaeota archaeon]
MELLTYEVILLGIVQGLTEWLPISSTGHIRLLKYFLQISFPLIFDVSLHIGTLIVTLVFFRSDVKGVFKALIRFDFKSKDGAIIPLIAIGSIPTAIIGLLVNVFLEEKLHGLNALTIAFMASGAIVWFSKFKWREERRMNWFSAVMVGIAQGFSTIPGLSRSGLTIAVALMLGIGYEEAFKFSFLLSIPAIIGALTLTFYTQSEILFKSRVGLDSLVGSLIAMLIGYLSLQILHRFIRKFHVFGFYSIILGLTLAIINFSAK